MIISHRKKFAFFANPKTGSKAAGIMLRMAGVFNTNDMMVRQPFAATRTANIALPCYGLDKSIDEHTTPEMAIEEGLITLDQLREYDCYAFLRDPEERYNASRIALVLNRHGHISNGRPPEEAHLPQHKYFFIGDEQVVTPLNFDDFHAELKRLYVKIEAPFRHMDIPEVEFKRTFPNDRYTYNPIQHKADIKLHAEMLRDESNNKQTYSPY